MRLRTRLYFRQMETFFILMVVVFLPFGWFIIRMLRYTKETVGADSPLTKERTYHISAAQYFSIFSESTLNAFVAIMMLVLAFITTREAIRQDLLLLLFPVCFLTFTGFFCFFIYFDWQYWTLTRNMLVTFNPFHPSITVDSPTQYYLLTPDNVVHIERHEKDSRRVSRMVAGYGYYLFYAIDGQIIQVNNRFFNDFIRTEFLERFFPNTPQSVIRHSSTWTTDLNYSGKLKSPNFAA